MEKMKAYVKKISTEQLKEVATNLMNDMRKESSIPFNVVLDELMERMPSPEFVSFCDSL